MKTKFALLIGAAIITLSFSFATVNSNKETAAQTTKTAVKEPMGGMVSEGKL
jgi:hypothetical protein